MKGLQFVIWVWKFEFERIIITVDMKSKQFNRYEFYFPFLSQCSIKNQLRTVQGHFGRILKNQKAYCRSDLCNSYKKEYVYR